MRGFLDRATVENALQWLESCLPPLSELPTETLPLRAAAGRVLARDVVSRVHVPGFARSMMDGYALRSEECSGASSYNTLPLQIIGTCLPGQPFAGRVEAGQAVRIMTGAPLPAGADAVLPVENSEVDGSQLIVQGEVSPGKHVGQIGEDIRAGETVLSAGRRLRPQDLGVLSSTGIGQVEVIRQPRVRIVITGNELLPAGSEPVACRIADANGPMLSALVRRDGAVAVESDILPDDPAAIRAALLEPADVVLVSGGSSVGQEDHAPRLVAELGELPIHGVAMRPSSPAGMGRLSDGRLVFLLPGNPVSCLCAYDFLAGRAIRALGGQNRDWPYRRVRVPLARKLVSVVGRVDYARVRIAEHGAEPLAVSGASVLSSTTRADGFVIVPADSEGFPPGAEVEVFLYE